MSLWKPVNDKVTAAHSNGADTEFSSFQLILPFSNTNRTDFLTVHSFLQSDFLTIILTDPVGDHPNPPTISGSTVIRADAQTSTTTSSVSSTKIRETVTLETGTPFYIHKALLASLSPEFYKHVYNNMSEGMEGILKLKEVDEHTMKRFLEWVYTKTYSVAENSIAALLPHIKVYTFAERFNITALKDFVCSQFITVLNDTGLVTEKSDVAHVLSVARYAFENLPTENLFPPPRESTTSSNSFSRSNATTTHQKATNLLKSFAEYISWSLCTFCHHPDFLSLLEDSPDFAKILVCNSPPSTNPHWLTVTSTTPNTHILTRYCKDCKYTGIPVVVCAFCERYDYEIGIEVQVGGRKVVLGEGRVSGTRTQPDYTCLWCGKTAEARYGRLYCKRCDSDEVILL